MNTNTRIIVKATEMFFTRGIRSITMDEIAESLGISKRTLYENFSNKEQLLKECIQHQYEENKKLQESILIEHPDDPLEVIFQHFRHAVIALNSLHPNFFNDLKKYHSLLWTKHIMSKQDESINFTREMLVRGIEKGVFRASADPVILSKTIHSVMQLMTLSNLFPENQFSRSEVFRQVLINFIRGMATTEGLKKIDEKFNLAE